MRYANLMRGTDIEPYEVLSISKTEKIMTIREMDCERDFEPKYVEGGFSAICTNQDQQAWKITSNESNPTIKAYLRKDGYYWSRRGKHKISDVPVKYYDHNF